MTIDQAETKDVAAQAGAKALYEIDAAHTTAEFAVKHMMFSTVKGRFTKVAGTIEVDEADPRRSAVVATAELASVDTGDAQRDAHLRSADFFDAENFPVLSFRSTSVEPKGNDGELRIAGDLTIRGVTREVIFDANYLGRGSDPWGNTRIGLNASTTIDRKDFDLKWNVALEAGGWLVGDTVKINLEVQAVKKG